MWEPGIALEQAIKPWSSFFLNPAVKKRIDNFALLQCKLMVKFVINGTPFHHGRMLVSYKPKDPYEAFESKATSLHLIYESQRSHIFLDPATSQGGCLCLPYVNDSTWMDVGSLNDFEIMGEISMRSLNLLQHAQLEAQNVHISVFCWAEDVNLCVPTVNLALQSKDEYGQGIVGRTASAVKGAANALKSIPFLQPFAIATEVGATVIGTVAGIFGFSRPNIITDQALMKNVLMGNIANCDAPDVSFKLTTDSKQQTTIDSRVCGLKGTDELSISYIASRQSFLTTAPWNEADLTGATLFSANVSPCLYDYAHVNLQDYEYALTPMAYASLPFKHWSGSIIFRFQIVASQFHRGRIRIGWDPASSDLYVNDNQNLTFNRIVDIAEERDFEVRVNWAGSEAYKKTEGVWYNHSHWAVGGVPTTDIDPIHHNGRIYATVLTNLISPVPADTIGINVFVRAGDDFQLRNPTEEHIKELSYFSGILQSKDEITSGENQPFETTPLVPFMEGGYDPLNDLVYFGEVITSFRSLLKRYNFYRDFDLRNDTIPVLTAKEVVYFRIRADAFPLYRGKFVPGAVDVSNGGKAINFCHMTLLNYLTPSYMCRRGGIRYKIHPTGQRTAITDVTVRRETKSATYNESHNVYKDDIDSKYENNYNAMFRPSMLTGAFVNPTLVQPGTEVEIPYHTSYRYTVPRENISVGTDTDASADQFIELTALVQTSETVEVVEFTAGLATYVAAAEDFNLCYFLNVRPLFIQVHPATWLTT